MSKSSVLDKLPPQDLAAEQSALGSILLDPETAERLLSRLQGSMFYREAHERIFNAMVALWEEGSPVDFVTVAEKLRTTPHRDTYGEPGSLLDAVGGASYLTVLLDSVPTAANGDYYAGIVVEKWQLREIVMTTQEVGEMAVSGFDTDQAKQRAAQLGDQLITLSSDTGPTEEEKDAKTVQVEMMDEILGREESKPIAGTPTGFPSLDALTSGIECSEYWIIAGSPGMGKTAVATAVACHISKRAPVLFVSGEMSSRSLHRRIYSMYSDVPARVLKCKAPTPDQRKRLIDIHHQVMDWKLNVVEPRMTLPEIRAAVRRDVKERGTQFVFIDHAHLIEAPGNGETEQVSRVANAILDLKRELNISIILLAQLSRANENRPDKRPQLSDLYHSRKLEANADVVIGVYRPGYYETPTPDETIPQPLELIVLKERGDSTGIAHASFLAERAFPFED